MQAKRFVGETRAAVRHLYATTIRGEVSDTTIQGYLRAASQIEDIWQQIDAQLAQLIATGHAPWEACTQLCYALIFIRAARTYEVFVKELLIADAALAPATAGYLPHITYDQANALCVQIEPALQEAISSLSNPAYVPAASLPLQLGPRIENEGRPCPVAHLQGIIAAAEEVREWAAGLAAEYQNAVQKTTIPVPTAVSAHLADIQRLLARADSQLRFGTDFAGQIMQGEATPEMHMQAENYLWAAMQQLFLLNQAIAMPELLHSGQPGVAETRWGTASNTYHDRRIQPDDLWRIAAPGARSQLQGTGFGSQEMTKMWQRMHGVLPATAQQYLDEAAMAVERDDAYPVAITANCPYEPIYRARRALTLVGTPVEADDEFHWNFHRDNIETTHRFGRTDDWQQCQTPERAVHGSSGRCQ